ncbi:hypothetical protein SDJN02_17149, partial [Cucurbita argyrosperma subsp. argyrosperma]
CPSALLTTVLSTNFQSFSDFSIFFSSLVITLRVFFFLLPAHCYFDSIVFSVRTEFDDLMEHKMRKVGQPLGLAGGQKL